MSYDINSIETLQFREAVRMRIPMYLGSNDMEGVYNGIQEIISNSIDEFIMGFGNKIEIVLYPDNYISVRDYGRGVPFGTRENGENVLEAIYSHAQTGGKFTSKDYQFAVGLNGIGAKATCLSSEEFSVVSVRDNRVASICFERGNMIDYTEVNNDKNLPNGTFVKYKPDTQVFNLEPIEIKFEHLCKTCENLSFLTKGLTFELRDETVSPAQSVIYKSENGLMDLVMQKAANKVHENPISYFLSDGTNSVEIACVWTKARNEHFYCFTNGVANAEGGTPITGLKTSITKTLQKKIKNLTGELARTGLIYAVSCKVVNPSFANQTKTKINNPELRWLASKAFSEGFEKFCLQYPNEEKKIEDFLTKEEKAEKAAEKARTAVLNATKDIEKNQKRKVFSSDKLSDAEYLGQDSTLLIVEGNSAAAAMAIARDEKHYGILAIRGKIINCLSNSEDKIFENEEIKLLLSAMNIIPGKYNSSKLRYGRIAICSDADSDGYHIGLLIMAALAYLAPDFIKEGRLCWLRSPLYIVNNKGKETYYFTDEEFNRDRAKIKGEVTRAKGLGELEAEVARQSMFTSGFQRMDVIEWNESAMDLLYDLMGEEVEPRRNFIMENVDFSEIKE